MKSKIRLYKIELFGYHGVHSEEKKNGQNFEVDIELSVDSAQAIQTDNIDFAVDYSKIYKQVADTFLSNRYSLIETLAADISESIISNFSVLSCKVIIRKPDVPINGKIDAVEVEHFQDG